MDSALPSLQSPPQQHKLPGTSETAHYHAGASFTGSFARRRSRTGCSPNGAPPPPSRSFHPPPAAPSNFTMCPRSLPRRSRLGPAGDLPQLTRQASCLGAEARRGRESSATCRRCRCRWQWGCRTRCWSHGRLYTQRSCRWAGAWGLRCLLRTSAAAGMAVGMGVTYLAF